MAISVTRRVEELYLDLDKLAELGLIDRDIEGSQNGLYTAVIVPEYLKGRLVVVVPVTENEEIADFETILSEAKKAR